MRMRQVVIYDSDSRLADILRPAAQAQAFRISEVRHLRACWGLLRQGAGNVLVMRVGRDVVREMEHLDSVQRHLPETAVIVVDDADNPALVQLAWDLGARHVLPASLARDELADVVTGLLLPRESTT